MYRTNKKIPTRPSGLNFSRVNLENNNLLEAIFLINVFFSEKPVRLAIVAALENPAVFTGFISYWSCYMLFKAWLFEWMH
ncbi:hypothetical protein A4H97_05285 [Niastella yeongjuensis]|uniref:Uncharacterized protein n=1 Tax=Niastella yeongjuensis TaxID=354355 RepID=A0A1V9ELV5_9BACT|nr:hypothetical protein A4H97_05285 [Niastella yeongjuensis]SEN61316.1 hypothetical protein SAMN05660816_01080 [Niastella yeongjuensis]